MKKIFLIALLSLIILPLRGGETGDTLVSLVVCGPGCDVYELEGHAALRVRTPHDDVAVHWGLFDFNAPGFVWRFALGETDYLCGATPWPYFEAAYSRSGRRITEHRLALTAPEKKRILELLESNLLPENRSYRYNYVKDNCATRPLAMVEAAIGDSLILPDAGIKGESFRHVMRRYHQGYPWYQFGIDLALGPNIDYALSAREKAFAPVVLDKQLPGAHTAGGRNLVEETIVVYDVPENAAVDGPTPWWATPMAVALVVLALAIAFTVRDQRRCRVTRWFDAVLYGVLGMAGCLVFFLVVFSTHEATSPNFLLWWVNPLCLLPVIFIWIKKARRLVICYQIANFAVLLALCVSWHWLSQSANAAIWPLMAADAMRALNYVTVNLRRP